MSQLTDYLSGYLNELDNYMDRLNNNKLSKKDQKLFLEMSSEYYELFSKAEIVNAADAIPGGFFKAMERFNENIISQSEESKDQANQYYESITKYANSYINTVRRTELMIGVFQTDAEMLRLQNEKLQMMQELVDQEMVLNGELTQEVQSILEVQQCEVSNGKVREISLWENLDDPTTEPEQSEKETKTMISRNNSESVISAEEIAPEQLGVAEKETYRAYAYMKETGAAQHPKPIYGSGSAEIIAMLQKWNEARTDTMKFQTCYIQKLNPDTNKYGKAVKYEIASGKDITPIYLNLPHMGKEEFAQLVKQLKADGAKYNPHKKAFYITRKDDLNKFEAYLPLAESQDEREEKQGKSEVNYVIEPGQEYYDNRVQVTIDGMKPFYVFGDDYDVHFPSMSAEDIRDVIEKFILPDFKEKLPVQGIPAEIEYNGKKYDPLQYEVLKMAEKQNFTKEQMALLERPELSSDRMNEVRFSIRDGLTADQIQSFASPNMEQWQMDLCRIGLQHGLSVDELKPLIDTAGYTPDKWGERRNQLQKLIHEKGQMDKGKGLLGKLGDNMRKVDEGRNEMKVKEDIDRNGSR